MVALMLCAHARIARAEESGGVMCGSEASVLVRFVGQGWPTGLARDTLADLRAGLRVRGIALCTGEEAVRVRPVATVLLHWNPFDSPQVSVEVQDEVTNKRVLRDLRLGPIAADARALALAQAADELLRASWIELRLHDAPEPAVPPPEVVEKTVELPSLEHGSAAQTRVLGARFASEIYGGGLKLFGADAYVAFWLADRLGISVAIGARAAQSLRAPHGQIDASALTASLGALFALWDRDDTFNMLLHLVGHVGELALTGRGDREGVRSQSQMAFIVSGRLEVCGVLRLTDALQIELAVGPGMSLRAATANDSHGAVVSSRGFELHGTLGLGGRL